MSLGFTVQPCAYCNTVTAIRYKNMYACLDHVADAQRDDAKAYGRVTAAELAARLRPATAAPDVPVRQVSLPAIRSHQPAQDAFERLGPQMVRQATLDVILPPVEPEVEIDGRLLSDDERRILEAQALFESSALDDPDPLHLEGYDPATKTYTTPSGVYEGMPEQLSAPAFVECDTCRAKPGSPVLCDDCLRRRDGTSAPDLPIVDVPDDWE